MSAPVRTPITPVSAFARGRVDPDDLGMGPVGPQEVRRGLAVHVVIGRVTALAGQQPEVFAAAFVRML